MTLTIDASVFVAASRSGEVNHSASRQLVEEARRRGIAIRCPALVLAECSGAIARTTGDPVLAGDLVALIEALPGIRFVATTTRPARRAATLAAAHRFRGADAIYVAVAARSRACLITWDREMLERAPAVVATMTPSEWLATQTRQP